MDSVANSRRNNVDGQMGLFDMGQQAEETSVPAVHVPQLPELSAAERMRMEK